jgi:integrase
MPRITKRYVDALKAGAVDVVHWDDDLTGFGVRVRPSGAKSYIFTYRAGGGRRGRLRKMTIASVGSIAPEEARKAAQGLNARAKAGADPAADKRAQRADLTVAELVERYLSEGPADKPDKKASSWSTDASNLRRHVVPLLGRRHLATLAKRDIQRFQASVTSGATKADRKSGKSRGRIRVRGGAGTAWRATVVLAAMLAWATERQLLKSNPAEKVRLNKLKSRERFLDDKELSRFGEVATAMEAEGVNPASLTIARLLVLTGARLGEIAAAKWEYLDVQRGALMLPDSKTDAKVVPLAGPALAVFLSWGEQFGDDRQGYVFPAARGDGHHQSAGKIWRQLRKRAGLTGVRLHDLRHSFASVGVSLNQSLFIVGKILGHTKAKTTERYSHLQLDPVRAAAEQTSKRVADALKGRGADPSKVAKLARPK